MWRRIALIFTNVVGFLVILGEAGSHYNYSNWAFSKIGYKAAVPMVQQHLYYVIMMIVIVLIIMAFVNYILRKKPQ